ncbi:hypothetical protein [Halobacterium zhouii]|nr:hypothetical protein [Halobacterium zhouii]
MKGRGLLAGEALVRSTAAITSEPSDMLSSGREQAEGFLAS